MGKKSIEDNIHSKDAEMMVLGCMLSSPSYFKSGFELLQLHAEDFYYIEHQAIFSSLHALHQEGRNGSDVFLVFEKLKDNGEFKKVEEIGYLTNLAVFAGTSSDFESYCEILKKFSMRRAFIARCDDLKKLALVEQKDIASIAALATSTFSRFTQNATQLTNQSIHEISKGEGNGSFLDELKQKRARGVTEGTWQIPGIPTGFNALDSALGGLRNENFIIVAARPSVGKTAFALNLLRNLGVEQKKPVALFSLEMTANQLFLRLLSTQSGVTASKIETGQVSDSEMEQIETAVQQLEESPIWINDSCYEINAMTAQMRKLVAEHEVCAFFIDYVGLIKPTKERDIKAYEIGDITRTLKNLANELQIPIVCLAQLNRQAEQCSKPQLSMLKDSGNLEQDADSVIFLHRRDDSSDQQGQIEIIIAKNRHGITDTFSFQFTKEIGVISEFSNKSNFVWN